MLVRSAKLRALRITLIALTTLWGLTFAAPAEAADYYVATTGSDSASGTTAATAWRTVAYAASAASPVGAGDTINVRGGTYAEYVQIGKSGTPGAPITLRPYANEPVVLTTGGTLGNIYAGGRCNWTIEDLEIKDSNGGAGIYWEDGCPGTVVLQRNVIHDTDSGDNASCIYLQRNMGTFVVRSNTLYDCDGTIPVNNTGIVVFGHIDTGHPGAVGLTIQNNEIYNEGVGIKIKHPFATDQTTAVDVSYNLLHDITGRSAIETAGGKFTTNKTNRIHHNIAHSTGTTPAIVVGVDFDEYGVEIDHNTAYGTGYGFQLCVADNCDNGGSHDERLHDNVFVPIARSGLSGYAIWTEITTTPFTSDYNCFWNVTPTTDVAQWGGFGGGIAQSLADWQARGFDTHSVRADPLFVNAAAHDFHLQGASGCKNLRGDGKDPGAYETGLEVIGTAGTAPSSGPTDGGVAGGDGGTAGIGNGGEGDAAAQNREAEGDAQEHSSSSASGCSIGAHERASRAAAPAASATAIAIALALSVLAIGRRARRRFAGTAALALGLGSSVACSGGTASEVGAPGADSARGPSGDGSRPGDGSSGGASVTDGGAGGDAGPASSANVFFQVGWESGAVAGSFDSAYFGSAAGSQFAVQGVVKATGAWALEHRLVGGQDPGSVQYATQHFGDAIAGPVPAAGKGQHFFDLHVQYKVHYSAGFDFNTRYKQFIIGTQDDADQSGICCNPWVAHYMTIYAGTGGTQLAEANNKQSESDQWVDFSANRGGYTEGSPFTLQSDRWYTIEVRRKLNDAGVDNGIFQMWVDGALIAEHTSVRFRVPRSGAVGSNMSYGTNFALLSDYPFDPPSKSQSVTYDDVKISTSYIGP